MKLLYTVPALLLAGCMTAPKDVFVKPEKYNCDLIIPTIWDGNYPVSHFEHELAVGVTYYDYMGMQYTLVETETPNVFALKVKVVSP